MSPSSLAALQAWMQARVTAGTWRSTEGEIPDVVAGSAALPAAARLGIYASSYVARLAECMRAEFPALRTLIGDQVFNLFVGGYLSARPPSSFSLYDLGAGFADYLEATRPHPHSGRGTPEALPASLARLERAMAECERAEGVEDSERRSFDPLSLLDDPQMRLRAPPNLKLLRLDFDFAPILAAARGVSVREMPRACDALVAVARSRYRVQVHRLEPWSFAWLAALAETGGDVLASISVAASVSGRDRGAILADLMLWLPVATERGFVA